MTFYPNFLKLAKVANSEILFRIAEHLLVIIDLDDIFDLVTGPFSFIKC